MAIATLSLLTTDKLTGENYTRWKNTINTIMIINDFHFVLMEDHPPIPAHNAPRNVQEAYEHLTRANEEARTYILASLNKVLAKKHEFILTAHEIMESLRGMFEQSSAQLMHDTLKHIFNARMQEGASVREHVLNMMVHFNVAEMNGLSIHETSQVSFIVESLSESFLHFRSNVVLNRIDYNMTTLLNELQTFQFLMKSKEQKGEENVAST
ncbi:uncharacterized protein LOC120075867 [Benincasa hispida]|uniref:uncharacterized protein LOC120075867 n=1 Tax=Benincasa hispida TaxID=102211 RepID=UPI001901B2A3|nr:uncharacterized protein LOC120075867 [Benincasa hispida]